MKDVLINEMLLTGQIRRFRATTKSTWNNDKDLVKDIPPISQAIPNYATSHGMLLCREI